MDRQEKRNKEELRIRPLENGGKEGEGKRTAEAGRRECLEERYERYKSILKDLTIMSDVFMRNVFKKRECTEYVLQVILKKEDLRIVDQVIQKDYKNLQGRSAILDCVARDCDGKQMDVEIQQENDGASPRRARYHSGLMDMNTLNPGQDFDELPESYVIFITREDYFGEGFPIYHIERKIEESDCYFGDEAHIVYVNAKNRDDTALGKLMHDLNCKNADEMYSEVLAKRVRELKESEVEVKRMCHELEQLYNEGIEYGMEKGELTKAREITCSLGEMGMSADKIAQAVKMSVSVVKEWLSESTKLAN